jgi:hypothetical protein
MTDDQTPRLVSVTERESLARKLKGGPRAVAVTPNGIRHRAREVLAFRVGRWNAACAVPIFAL